MFQTNNPFKVRKRDVLLCGYKSGSYFKPFKNRAQQVIFNSSDLVEIKSAVAWLYQVNLTAKKAQSLLGDRDRELAISKYRTSDYKAVKLLLPGGLTESEALKLLQKGARFSLRYFRFTDLTPHSPSKIDWDKFVERYKQGSRLTPEGVSKMIRGRGSKFTLVDLYQMLEATFSRSQLSRIIGRRPL